MVLRRFAPRPPGASPHVAAPWRRRRPGPIRLAPRSLPFRDGACETGVRSWSWESSFHCLKLVLVPRCPKQMGNRSSDVSDRIEVGVVVPNDEVVGMAARSHEFAGYLPHPQPGRGCLDYMGRPVQQNADRSPILGPRHDFRDDTLGEIGWQCATASSTGAEMPAFANPPQFLMIRSV